MRAIKPSFIARRHGGCRYCRSLSKHFASAQLRHIVLKVGVTAVAWAIATNGDMRRPDAIFWTVARTILDYFPALRH
jgi:hypothetical protein